MGTNIQLHHPTPEDFGGKALEGLQRQSRAHPPRHHPVDPRVVSRGRLRRGRDLHLSDRRRIAFASGGIEEKTRELNVAAAAWLAPRATSTRRPTSRASSPARSDRPGCCLSSSDPVLSNTTFDELEENYYIAGEVPRRRRRRRAARRDGAGHPRGEGGDRRLRASVRRDRATRRDAGAGHARHERTHAARHRHRERA